MQRFPLVGLLTLALLAGFAAPLRAEPAPADYRKLNAALIERHVVPRYRALAAATAVLSGNAKAFCKAPDAAGLASLKAVFLKGVDAWQGIQHVRFGPVDLFMRSMRMAFWPDPRDTAGRQLEQALQKRDKTAIDPKGFADHSVAVQGFPALERLLFDDGAEKALLAKDDAGAFRCAFAMAVAQNLKTVAADLVREWTEGDKAFSKVIADGNADPYRTPKEATLELFKCLHTAVELVADHKLKKPLGPVAKRARPKLAESWRSKHSLANVRTNLAAAEAMYLGEGEDGFSAFVVGVAGNKDLDDLLRRAFAQTRRTAESVKIPLAEAIIAKDERPKVERLQTEAAALKAILAKDLTAALGIPLGFNALDGD